MFIWFGIPRIEKKLGGHVGFLFWLGGGEKGGEVLAGGGGGSVLNEREGEGGSITGAVMMSLQGGGCYIFFFRGQNSHQGKDQILVLRASCWGPRTRGICVF